MTTLDDLLALLPDNTEGAITAAAMREVVTALWGNDAALDGRITDLDTVTSGQISGLDGHITALENTVDTNASTAAAAYASLDSRVDALEHPPS